MVGKRHNLWGTAEYRAWQNMRRRCYEKTNKKYASYGGRGIEVCEERRASPERFYLDMGPRPSPRHSLDRIDNDGNYEPSNCRWATSQQQFENRSGRASVFKPRKLFELGGEILPLNAWAKRYGVSSAAVRYRMGKRGWGLHKSLATPFVYTRANGAQQRGAC